MKKTVAAVILTITFALLILSGCARQTSVGTLSLQSLRGKGEYPDRQILPFSELTETEFGLLGGIDAALEFLNSVPFMLPNPIMESLLDTTTNIAFPDKGIRFEQVEAGLFDTNNSEEADLRNKGLQERSLYVHTPGKPPVAISFFTDNNDNPVVHPAHKKAITKPDVYHLFSVKSSSVSFDVYESRALWPDSHFFAGWFMADSVELFEQAQPVHLLIIGESFTASLGYLSSSDVGTGITKENRNEFLSPNNWIILKH